MSTIAQQSDEIPSTPGTPQPNPLLRVLVCGFLVFMTYFGFTSWRHNGNFDVPRITLRYSSHLIIPILVAWYLSRGKAWSYLKATSFLFVFSAILLLATGLVPFLENGATTEEQDRLINNVVNRINDFSNNLESVSDTTSAQASLSQLDQLNEYVEDMISQINQLPELTEWHASKLQKKYAPVIARIQARLDLAMDDLKKKGIDVTGFRKGIVLLHGYLSDLLQGIKVVAAIALCKGLIRHTCSA